MWYGISENALNAELIGKFKLNFSLFDVSTSTVLLGLSGDLIKKRNFNSGSLGSSGSGSLGSSGSDFFKFSEYFTSNTQFKIIIIIKNIDSINKDLFELSDDIIYI